MRMLNMTNFHILMELSITYVRGTQPCVRSQSTNDIITNKLTHHSWVTIQTRLIVLCNMIMAQPQVQDTIVLCNMIMAQLQVQDTV